MWERARLILSINDKTELGRARQWEVESESSFIIIFYIIYIFIYSERSRINRCRDTLLVPRWVPKECPRFYPVLGRILGDFTSSSQTGDFPTRLSRGPTANFFCYSYSSSWRNRIGHSSVHPLWLWFCSIIDNFTI